MADTSTKFDELTATILVLEEDISQKKRDIEDLSNQRKLITSEIEVLTNEGMDENEIFFDKFLDSGSK